MYTNYDHIPRKASVVGSGGVFSGVPREMGGKNSKLLRSQAFVQDTAARPDEKKKTKSLELPDTNVMRLSDPAKVNVVETQQWVFSKK